MVENAVLTALEFPQDVVSGVPKITILGKGGVSVENFVSLLEYNRENIRLKFADGVIDISGNDLEICAIDEGNITISGKIESVRFI